jgi:hypothetical protein
MAVVVPGGKKKYGASINDLLLLHSVRQATDRRLRSTGFCGEVSVLLNSCVQGFQPATEGQRLSVVHGLVDAYVDDLLVDMDV